MISNPLFLRPQRQTIVGGLQRYDRNLSRCRAARQDRNLLRRRRSRHALRVDKRAAAASGYQVYIARSVGRCREWPELQLNTLDPDVAEAVERGAAVLFLAGYGPSDPAPTKCSGRRERGLPQSAAGGDKTIPAFLG